MGLGDERCCRAPIWKQRGRVDGGYMVHAEQRIQRVPVQYRYGLFGAAPNGAGKFIVGITHWVQVGYGGHPLRRLGVLAVNLSTGGLRRSASESFRRIRFADRQL